ncbi:hypothetical protein GIB67_029351 [Kingdonia uniflora]|uniref:DDE Tnp4 domain-containing protein n=1 Tax=Kingdonia uniflora TaxID=39325 RepID=A0A7J7M545_9MAGN|nr:hypothetical protein GIB67_029351 [Kingdonia uniflora]
MRSLETISKYFHVVLKYVLRLGKDLIKHATPNLSLANRSNHHAWANTYFKDCVGAVDGTFIPATIVLEDQSRILRVAVNDDMYSFTVSRDHYYLGDAGFPQAHGFLVPYRGVRYHLKEHGEGNSPQTPQELYNYRHSQLRNIIERLFGVMKRQFVRLCTEPYYDVET